MTRMIFCTKLQANNEGLDKPPFPGTLGEKIYLHISKQAWKMWLDHQTMLINEYRLSLIDPKARQFLQEQLQCFLFEGGAEKPQGYVPPSENGK